MLFKKLFFLFILNLVAFQINYAQKPKLETLQEYSFLKPPETELRQNMRINIRTNVPVALFGINYGPLTGNPESIARQFFSEQQEMFKMKSDLSDLQHDITQESPGGYHVRFHQNFQGIPVYLSDIVVSISSNSVTTFMGNYFPDISLSTVKATISEIEAVQKAKIALNAIGKLTGEQIIELMVVPNSVQYLLAYRIILPLSDPDGEWEIFLDAQTGELLALRDISFYYDGQGYVYKPDPLTTAQEYYGASGYVDNNDGDSAELTNQRIQVTLSDITFSEGVYRLEGPYVTLSDWDTPSIAPVTSTDGNFFYTRSENGFEDVMVYFHIDQNQRYLQSLGFTNIQDDGITVDPHGYDGADRSSYQSSQNRIRYGIGGVDDAEDADVILHEYGHAIQEAQVAGWGAIEETEAMGEGFGDYWAGSYSASISSFEQAQVFIWDAGITSDYSATFWSARRLDSQKTYSDYDEEESIHTNGTIWSGTLWDIWQTLGRNVTDKLVIKHHYYLSSSAKMADAAQSLLQADRDLFGGIHLSQLNQKLYDRGFRPVLNVPSVFATIESALSAALSGQTVIVSSGTYTENINMKANVDLIGAGESSTTIDGTVTFNNDDNASLTSMTVKKKISITNSDFVNLSLKTTGNGYIDATGSWINVFDYISTYTQYLMRKSIYAHNYSNLDFWGGVVKNKDMAVYLYLGTDALIEEVDFCQNNLDVNADYGSYAELNQCEFSSSEEGESVEGDVDWYEWDYCGMALKKDNIVW